MKNNNIEKRCFAVEYRKREEGQDKRSTMTGHAAIFNEETRIGNWFREQIAPGAFAESVQKDDIRALFNHNPDFVLGRNKAGTLRLAEDEKGLAIEIDPPDTTQAKDLSILMERGDISQMSFAFEVMGEEWTYGDGDGELDLRTITKVKLYDVSPVTFPAYEGTDIALHSRDAFRAKIEAPVVKPRGTWLKRASLRLREVSK